jgi:trimethylamine--corrinoid protein Co-methyltransferase
LSDAQAGHEKTITSLLPALAGANIIYGMGMLEMGMTFSFGQLVLDDAIARMVKRVVRGVDVTDYTLAVDEIKEVGGGQGKDFFTLDHTIDNMRTEQAVGGIFDRTPRMIWEVAVGGKDVGVRAAEIAREVLATHKPEPLEQSVKNELRRIVASAE